ncbi:MAG: GyrI-like domain-containing protein [Clostridia bacterium]|nr:GyrI-like domain-containing protein [Clostridia bacterium]
MALQIVSAHIEDCSACRFIGKRYTPADSMNGGYGHKWGEWWQNGWFAPIDKLLHMPIVGDSTMAAMHVVDGELEYWIGFFCPPDTDVPEGYEAIDVGPRSYAVLWKKGSEHNGELYGLEAHVLCLQELTKHGWKRVEDDWCFERYNCPRFTTPDANGEVILDYGISVEVSS